jgi:hypothetical protein
MVEANTIDSSDSTISSSDPRWGQLRAPFPADEIEYLPQAVSRGAEKGPCNRPDRNGYQCGGYHAMPAIHLAYIGHAGLTERLNAVDPHWTWEPAYREISDQAQALITAALVAGEPELARQILQGCPAKYTEDGLWIRLTVLGVTRLGYGDAAGKSGPNAVKERIGDALRNAALRFGVASYLWSKSEKAKAMAACHEPVEDAAPKQDVERRQQERSKSREASRRPERDQCTAPATGAVVVASAPVAVEADPLAMDRALLAVEAAGLSPDLADLRRIWFKASTELILDVPVQPDVAQGRVVGVEGPVLLRVWLTAVMGWMKPGRVACLGDIAAEPVEVAL